MITYRKSLVFSVVAILLLWFPNAPLQAQEQLSFSDTVLNTAPDYYIVNQIIILGHKKTKRYIILREIPFREGDTLRSEKLGSILKSTHDFIYNTKLFVTVKVDTLHVRGNLINVTVLVKERWYTYPLPYLELADRSLNEWIHTHNADLRWLSYGIYFIQENFSGRKDRLEVKAVFGFNKNFFVEYTAPYINKTLTDGLRFSAGLDIPRETRYITSDSNKLQYYRGEDPVKTEWFAGISYLARKKLKKKEHFGIFYHHARIADSIAHFYNPNYFSNGRSLEEYIELRYKLQYDDVDNILYPLEGKTFQLKVEKRGLGWKGKMNRLLIEPQYHYYHHLGKDWYSLFSVAGQLKLPFDQPYINLKNLGYDEHYLRGYERFVIDGQAFAYVKGTLKKKIVHFRLPTFLNSPTYSTIPFTFYGKIYSDLGYAYSRQPSLLANQLLWGGGIGLDIVTIYDFTIMLELSWNQLGQKGLFLHN